MEHPFQYVLYKEQEIALVLNDLANVYQEVFRVDDKMRDLLAWRIEKSIQEKKNPLVIACFHAGELIGAVFGFDYLPSNYWAQHVHEYLPHQIDWFESSFELNELFVKQKFQRHGIGGKLVSKLCNTTNHCHVLLSTQTFENEHVLQFYKKHRFTVLADRVLFPNNETVFSVLVYQKA